MRSVEVVGRTKEEALDLALKELKVDRDKVQVEILEEVNNKGLLGDQYQPGPAQGQGQG